MSSYTFWSSTLAKVKEYSKEDPKVKVLFAKSSKEGSVLNSLKSPDGEHVIIVGSRSVPEGVQFKEETPEFSPDTPVRYPFPYETPTNSNSPTFNLERERFVREFNVTNTASFDPKTTTYIISASMGQVLIDLNDPAVMEMRKSSNIIQNLLKIVNDPPLQTESVEEFNKHVRILPKNADVDYGGVRYNAETLQKIGKVFERGQLNLYQVKGLEDKDEKGTPIAVSDGDGHFILTVGH